MEPGFHSKLSAVGASDFLVLALVALCPGDPFSPRQTWSIGRPPCNTHNRTWLPPVYNFLDLGHSYSCNPNTAIQSNEHFQPPTAIKNLFARCSRDPELNKDVNPTFRPLVSNLKGRKHMVFHQDVMHYLQHCTCTNIRFRCSCVCNTDIDFHLAAQLFTTTVQHLCENSVGLGAWSCSSMQRILVKYFNEKKNTAVVMKTQGDLGLNNTWPITYWFLKVFLMMVMMMACLQSYSLDEGQEEKQTGRPPYRKHLCLNIKHSF